MSCHVMSCNASIPMGFQCITVCILSCAWIIAFILPYACMLPYEQTASVRADKPDFSALKPRWGRPYWGHSPGELHCAVQNHQPGRP